MSWTKHVGTPSFDAREFLSAMLPNWFAEAIDTGMPETAIHEKLRAFMLEAEIYVATEENRSPNLTPPTDAYIQQIYALYCDLLNESRQTAS